MCASESCASYRSCRAGAQDWWTRERPASFPDRKCSLAEAKPAFGPATAASFDLTNQLDRGRIGAAVERRERYYRRLQSFLGPHDLLCMPTTPALAPDKNELLPRASSGSGYYLRALALTSVAGIDRLPQVSLPVARFAGVPVGLSLLAGHGHDAFLLDVVRGLP